MTLPLSVWAVVPLNRRVPFPTILPLLTRLAFTFNEDPVFIVRVAPVAMVKLLVVPNADAAIEGAYVVPESIVTLSVAPGTKPHDQFAAVFQSVDVLPNHCIAFTATLTEVVAVPQPVVTVYDMFAEPVVTPVTTPPLTVATAELLLLHVPPLAASDNVTAAATHVCVVPDIVPAFGTGLTATDDEVAAVVLVQPLPGYVTDKL